MPGKSLLEVQFPIAQLSLESYLERDARTGKILNSLGKWWGTKPIVLTRAVIIASLFEASDDTDRWPEDLEMFFKLMCFDSAGMWKRRNEDLVENSFKPPHPRFVELCHPLARLDEADLFKSDKAWRPRMSDDDRARREALERRVFWTLDHVTQRRYTGRVEEIDGPPRRVGKRSTLTAAHTLPVCGSGSPKCPSAASVAACASAMRSAAWDRFRLRRRTWDVTFTRPT